MGNKNRLRVTFGWGTLPIELGLVVGAELPSEGPYGFARPFTLVLAITNRRLHERGESRTHLVLLHAS